MLDNRVVSYPPPRDGLNLRASDLDRSMACTALDSEWTSTRQDVLGVYFAPGASGAATVLSWWKQHNQLR
jgi:hypothetical protein